MCFYCCLNSRLTSKTTVVCLMCLRRRLHVQTSQDEPFLQQTSTKWNKDQFHPSKTQSDVRYAVLKQSERAERKNTKTAEKKNSPISC